MLESLFSGTALQAVDTEGGMLLPPFVLGALARRSEARRLLFAPHEVDPCMSGYDPGYEAWLFAEVERRRPVPAHDRASKAHISTSLS